MDAQSGLCLCCSHATKSGFLVTCPPLLRVNVYIVINVYLIKERTLKNNVSLYT